jgi:hypothetical protein
MEMELIPQETLIILDDWLCDESKDPIVNQLEASGMTDEEKGLKNFTRGTLKISWKTYIDCLLPERSISQ